MKYQKLFDSYHLSNIRLTNRFVMAPMTRSRASIPNNIANDLMATYYAQRSSAGLIISEATPVSLQGMGYDRTPGIYSTEQTEGWKKTTHAVHQQGGKIFLQLWHVGRVSSSKVNGLQPIAPSALIAKNTQVYIFENANKNVTFVPVETPKAMTQNDIDNTIKDFVHGAQNAMIAGFDGVEIHGANGYLIDQFLRSNSNMRNDKYGGSKKNRITFLIEMTKQIIHTIGKDKVGVRLSPFIKFKDMNDPEILDTIMIAAQQLNDLNIAYIHLCEADWNDAPPIPLQFRKQLRTIFTNTIIATGNKNLEEAEHLLQNNLVDLVGFGRKFIANPDYVERVKHNAPLNEISDTHTLFGGGTEVGYTDYPFLK